MRYCAIITAGVLAASLFAIEQNTVSDLNLNGHTLKRVAGFTKNPTNDYNMWEGWQVTNMFISATNMIIFYHAEPRDRAHVIVRSVYDSQARDKIWTNTVLTNLAANLVSSTNVLADYVLAQVIAMTNDIITREAAYNDPGVISIVNSLVPFYDRTATNAAMLDVVSRAYVKKSGDSTYASIAVTGTIKTTDKVIAYVAKPATTTNTAWLNFEAWHSTVSFLVKKYGKQIKKSGLTRAFESGDIADNFDMDGDGLQTSTVAAITTLYQAPGYDAYGAARPEALDNFCVAPGNVAGHIMTKSQVDARWSANATLTTVWVSASSVSPTENGTMQSPYRTLSNGMVNCANGGTVRIMPGTYIESLPVINKNMSIIGSGRDSVFLRNLTGGCLFTDVAGASPGVCSLFLKNVTITTTNLTSNLGAVMVRGGLSVDSCAFVQCYSSGQGSAIALASLSSGTPDVVIRNTIFNGCYSVGDGGAIGRNAMVGAIKMFCTDSEFINCRSGGYGGAYCGSYRDGAVGVVATLFNCTFDGCISGIRGGSAVSATLVGCSVAGWNYPVGFGGTNTRTGGFYFSTLRQCSSNGLALVL